MIVAHRVPVVDVRYVRYSIASQRAPTQGTQQLNLKPATSQVLFVAFGRLMYLGPPDGVLPWFSGRLGFPYEPAADGLPSDWVMDMVSPDVLAKKVSAPSHSRALVLQVCSPVRRSVVRGCAAQLSSTYHSLMPAHAYIAPSDAWPGQRHA